MKTFKRILVALAMIITLLLITGGLIYLTEFVEKSPYAWHLFGAASLVFLFFWAWKFAKEMIK